MRETGLDNLGVNFDPANLMMSGRANSLDALRMFRGCLYGVHGEGRALSGRGERQGKPRIVAASLGNDAGFIGGTMLAMEIR